MNGDNDKIDDSAVSSVQNNLSTSRIGLTAGSHTPSLFVDAKAGIAGVNGFTQNQEFSGKGFSYGADAHVTFPI